MAASISYSIVIYLLQVLYAPAAQQQAGDEAPVRVISFEDFERMSSRADDTTYIFNFWATWCKPCVKELPHFEEVNRKYADRKVKVVLISLDFVKQMESSLVPFVQKNHIQSEVYLLNDPDYDSWIDKVDPGWSGAIPGTLVVNNKKKFRKFYEQEFTLEQLEETIKPVIEQ